MGVSYGGWIALSPSITAQLFGPVGLGGVLGALYTSAGIGGLIGPPLTGVIIDNRGYPFAISIVMIVAFCSLPLLVKALRAKAPEGKETFDIPVTFFILDLLSQITEDYDNSQASEHAKPSKSL
jgi:MFS family permease